jgi:subtilisin family serine protease
MFKLKLLRETFCCLSVLLVANCGGGGGSGNSQSISQSYNFSQGQKSSEGAATEALAVNDRRFSLPYRAPNGNYYSSLAKAHVSLNGSGTDLVATADTRARYAWKDGWTGKGVKIGVADRFNSNGVIDAHGDWVAIVAASVAPEAKFGYQDVLGAYSLLGLVGNVDAAYDYFERNGYHIINNSWGIERPERAWDGSYTGRSWADFDELVRVSAAAFDPNDPSSAKGLYIMAAGNGGQYCYTRRVERCNWVAAVTDAIRKKGYTKAGPRLMFVGALDDNGVSLAGYSYYAGNLKNDFIVANDDVISKGDAAGTSFAAPRVAGAAALVKQKFPSLTSAQIKQVLLQTADDLGPTGVDAIYGHGKLNVMNALSPQGKVVPK